MMNILPILIVLVIVVGIISLVSQIMKRTGNRKGKYSYSNRVRRIFVSYLAILLICVVLDSVLPAKGMTEWKKVHKQDLEKEGLDLHEAAVKGQIAKVDHEFRVKNWNFDYHGQKLNTAIKSNEFLNTQIVIERKNTNDDKIEATYYKTRSSMNNLDITSIYKPIGLKLEGDQLSFLAPQKSKMNFSEFANVFSVNQFTGEKSFSHNSEFMEGQSILYLRIPKDLQIIDKSNLSFEYVE